MRRTYIYFVIFGLLAGCATNTPPEIRAPMKNAPTLAEVSQDITGHVGADVRWGGQIAAIENKPEETRVEIVARSLQYFGRPVDADYSPGRFIALVPQFLDPKVYGEGRAFTVSGTVTGSFDGWVGQSPYQFPIVRVREFKLWPPIVERPYHSNHYPWHDHWHDPWYDPWYDHWQHPWPTRRYWHPQHHIRD